MEFALDKLSLLFATAPHVLALILGLAAVGWIGHVANPTISLSISSAGTPARQQCAPSPTSELNTIGNSVKRSAGRAGGQTG